MKPTADQPKPPEFKPGSKPHAKDDLKALPLAEVEKKLGSSPDGLSQAEAQKRLTQYGPNEIEEKKTNEFLKFLTYFWGPILWMIEAAVILSAVARHWPDFGIILVLLLANAVVGFWEEHQAGNAIAALKAKLAIKARVKRNGKWVNPPARELVPGDAIRLRLGDIVPADARLLAGDPIEVDQSALTGEPLPATRKSSAAVFSGSIVRQGEIGALVYATGANTYFGKTAELVQEARTVSHFQRAVLKIGDYLIVLAVGLVAVIITVALFRGDPILTTLQFALVLTVAAIPVAMPTVLSVTMAVGARLLARREAIVTRLVAIEELAGVDVLCADKTGTLTQNKLTLGDPFSVNKIPAEQVILCAALASRADDNDTIDLAVLGGLKDFQALKGYKVGHFQPFDPVHKRTEAAVTGPDGKAFKVAKGAPQVILALSANAAEVKPAVEKAVNEFAVRGFRSLGVARADGDGKWQFLGVLPLFDPPREDAKATIATARQMGVKVKMVTGDALAIAQETAKKLGMGTDILDASGLTAFHCCATTPLGSIVSVRNASSKLVAVHSSERGAMPYAVIGTTTKSPLCSRQNCSMQRETSSPK
jgi:H+-transporting ATPase